MTTGIVNGSGIRDRRHHVRGGVALSLRDHTANTNDFAKSTWRVRQVERDADVRGQAAGPRSAEHVLGDAQCEDDDREDDHDVFGDGTVVLKVTPGHTPGHQVLYVKLAKTGGVVLSGDLYHYPEERTLNRIPTFDDNQQQQTGAFAPDRLVAVGWYVVTPAGLYAVAALRVGIGLVLQYRSSSFRPSAHYWRTTGQLIDVRPSLACSRRRDGNLRAAADA